MMNRSENAERFLEKMQIKTGRAAYLGRPDDYSNEPRRHIQAANDAMAKSVDIVVRLAGDVRKTDHDKHYRARQEANDLIPTLVKSRDGLHAEANRIERGAWDKIGAGLSLDSSRMLPQYLKTLWLKEQYQKGAEGLTAINKAIASDVELGAIIISNEDYILGMSPQSRDAFVATAILQHMPEAHAEMKFADKVRKTADKYDSVIKEVRTSFYNEMMAETAERTHVE